MRNLHIIFYSSWTNLHSYPQCTSSPFSTHPRQHLFLVFLVCIWRPHFSLKYCISQEQRSFQIYSKAKHAYLKKLTGYLTLSLTEQLSSFLKILFQRIHLTSDFKLQDFKLPMGQTSDFIGNQELNSQKTNKQMKKF